MTNVAEIGRQLAEVATSSAIEKAHYGDLVADMRRTMDRQIRHAELEARKAWRLGYVAGIAAIALMIVSGWLGWWVHRDTIKHNIRVVGLTEAVSLARGRTEAMGDSLKLARDDLKQANTIHAEMRERLALLRNENEHLQAGLAASETRRDNAVSRLKLFQIERASETTQLNAELGDLRSRADVLASSFEQTCDELEQALAEVDNAQAELLDARSGYERLQAKLAAALADRGEAVAKSEQREHEHNVEVMKLTEAASAAQSRADVLADALDKTWADLEQANEATKEKEARLSKMRSENERFQANLATAYAQRDDAVARSDQLEVQLERIEEQLAAKTTLIDQLRAVFAAPETEERTAGR